jgi:uncharacterized protein (TIGR03083 family)
MGEVWPMIAAERMGLAGELSGLTEEQWATPSLCAGWAVRDVVAHLLMPFHVRLPKLIWMMATNGFSFDKVSDKYARADSRPTAALIDDLRANAAHRFTPPGFGPEAPLTDLVVHGQDIRHPLGLAHEIPDEHARVVLDLLVSPRASRGFSKKGLLTGLRLEVEGLDWSYGSGPVVAGRAEPLIMALAGRNATLDALTGPGLPEFRRRM